MVLGAPSSPLPSARLIRLALILGVVLVLSGLLILEVPRQADADGQLAPWSEHIAGHWDRLQGYASESLGRLGGGGGGAKGVGGSARVREWRRRMESQEEQFGRRVLRKSVTHVGSGLRLDRALHKLARGEAMTISALGGSVTAGANMPFDSETNQWIGRFYTMINETFPNPAHDFSIGARGGLGSSYYQYCGMEHMHHPSDIIFVEHTVNDWPSDHSYATFENEIRALLQLENRPAVVCIEVMKMWKGSRLTSASGQQLDVCRFYDLPFISLRDALLPELIAHPARIPDFYGRDTGGVNLGHVSTRGHWALGNMVEHFFFSRLVQLAQEGELDVQNEVDLERSPFDENILNVDGSLIAYDPAEVDVWRERDPVEGPLETRWGDELVVNDVPRIGLTDEMDFTTVRTHLAPRCDALNGTRHKLAFETVSMGKKLDNGQELDEPGEGWIEWFSSQSWLAKYYVMTTSRYAVVRFDLDIKGDGTAGLSYLRSPSLGFGHADCWIDDDREHAQRLNGYWTESDNSGDTAILSQDLSKGPHTLSCELVEGNEFRIIAVITS